MCRRDAAPGYEQGFDGWGDCRSDGAINRNDGGPISARSLLAGPQQSAGCPQAVAEQLLHSRAGLDGGVAQTLGRLRRTDSGSRALHLTVEGATALDTYRIPNGDAEDESGSASHGAAFSRVRWDCACPSRDTISPAPFRGSSIGRAPDC